MEEIRETLWKRCSSTPTKPPAKNSSICLLETTYQHKGTRKKCKKTDQAAINSVTAAVSNGQTASQALTEVENKQYNAV